MQNLKYPIYIISKGRYKNPITAKCFMRENIDFLIAVEPEEYNFYKKTIPTKNILQLPFSNLGLGSFPARNYCWEHSMKSNYKKHFLFDDNIYRYYKLENGKRSKCSCLEAFIVLQIFTDQYKNVGISGFNYEYFVTSETNKPFTINTHIYSAMLINNQIPYRWRLKYNEDVDLCLQVLHNKLCTISLNVYLAKKVSTVNKLKGGNQDDLYQNNNPDKKRLKTKTLEAVWPQYVKSGIRFDRPHHYVNWNKHFRHPLIRKTI